MASLVCAAAACGGEPGYVAPESCRPCHAEIYASYMQTGMGRSFRRATPDLIPAGSYLHQKSQREYRVVRRAAGTYLERTQPAPLEKRIDFVVGSGNHSRTYLHRAGHGGLVELPLSWYAGGGGHWAMSPGYDRPDHSEFRRRVPDSCLFCHNGYPSEANGGLAAGIDCQRCHGPGERHVASGGAIVNPAKLSPGRRMEVCLQCHLESAGRSIPDAIRRFERGPFSYRPGEPLGDFTIFFDAAPRGGERITVNSSAYRLRQSACFVRSAGKLTCTTCHDPHRRARKGQYAKACLQCHASHSAAGAGDCVSCHMPKRRTEDAVHVVMTDHRIARRPPAGDLLAPLSETHGRYSGDVVLSYPAQLQDPLYLLLARLIHAPQPRTVIPEMRRALAGLQPAAAQFYFEMAEACRKEGLSTEAIGFYQESLRRNSEHAPAYVAIAQELIGRGETRGAVSLLEAAIERMPRDVDLLNSLAVAGSAVRRSLAAAGAGARSRPGRPAYLAEPGSLPAAEGRPRRRRRGVWKRAPSATGFRQGAAFAGAAGAMNARRYLAACLLLAGCSRRSEAPPEAAYVEARVCAGCHAAIAKNYAQTGMGRSFYTPGAQPEIEDWTRSNSFYHAASRRHYRMIRRGGELYQQRYQIDARGRERHVLERQVHFIVGSGNHARTYLHRSESGELTQLPVTWYSAERGWAMSPGYDRAGHPDFSRRIDHGCMFCHNAYPRVPPGTDRYGGVAEFPAVLPAGIDCQRCHGPGSRHVQLASNGQAAEKVRAAIGNPARLPPERQLEVCMQCHLETTSAPLPASTRRFGRAAYSFRAGEPLAEYIVHFDHPPGGAHRAKFEIAGAAYRLRQSPCFLKSAGRLTCTTCHNPHRRAVDGQYTRACRQCHSGAHASEERDCAGCHMPKRRTEDAVHVVMTDHLIHRVPPGRDLLAPMAERHAEYRGPVALYYPQELPEAERELYLGLASVADGADRRRGIQMLEHASARGAPAKALAELAGAYVQESRWGDAIATYRKALAVEPGMALARYNLAQALEKNGALADAEREYEQASSEHPRLAEAHYSLGSLLLRTGRGPQAEQRLREALRLRPDYAEAYNNLGLALLEQARPQEALGAFAEALRIDPSSADGYSNSAKALALLGRTAEALEEVRLALGISPRHAEARVNHGRLLYSSGRRDAAIAEFRQAAAHHPDFAEAHRSLGVALGEKGDLEGAIGAFRQVLRILPGDAEARQNLETALAMKR